MLETLISYLSDNKYQILEVWLTEVDLNPPGEVGGVEQGGLPIIYLECVFGDIVKILRHGEAVDLTGVHQLNEYMGVTFECDTRHKQSLACLEILLAGYSAFSSVLLPEWDTAGEFSEEEREVYLGWIKKALAVAMRMEIQKCSKCADKESCPFIAEGEILKEKGF